MTKLILGKGLNSLIPKKPFNVPSLLEKESPVPSGLKLKKESIFNIEIDRIKPNPDQPRQKFFPDSLRELADSIREHGILQPLLVGKVEKDTDVGREVEYQLIAGERRWRAAQIAGLPHVPVIIRDNTAKERLEISLIENVQREDLNPIERAVAYKQLHEQFGLTHQAIAKRVSKSRPTISNTIRLLELPNRIKQAVESGQILESHARTLLSVGDNDKQIELLEQVIKGEISIRQLEDKTKPDNVSFEPRLASTKRDPAIVTLEKQLSHCLGTRVFIRYRENTGSLIINFYNQKELDNIASRLIKD